MSIINYILSLLTSEDRKYNVNYDMGRLCTVENECIVYLINVNLIIYYISTSKIYISWSGIKPNKIDIYFFYFTIFYQYLFFIFFSFFHY